MPGIATGAVARKPSARAGDRLARGHIGDHEREDGADGRREGAEDERVSKASLVADSSKNTKSILCSVKLSSETNCEATCENAALSSAP